MVYSGKPSTGCQTCRKRRIKCDEQRPTCAQCIKSKRECLGYRDTTDLIFRNETTTGETRSPRKRSRIVIDQYISDSESNASTLQKVPKSLSDSVESQALCYFFSEFVMIPRHMESVRGYIEFLLPVYVTAKRESPVFSATCAVSLAAFGLRRGAKTVMKHSQEAYGRSVVALHEAISDPVASRSNDTLMAVLLLSLFDTITATKSSLFQWGTHADGAAALVKQRGDAMRETPISRKLYWAVNSQIVINNVIKCEPVEPYLDWTNLWSDPKPIDYTENASNRLTLITLRLPALRYAAMKYLRAPMTSDVALKVMDLMGNAKTLDQVLSAWPFTLPSSWQYRCASTIEGQIGDPETWEYWPGPVDSYYDLWVANVWNSYRTSRIFCQSIIRNCCERLFHPSVLLTAPEYIAASHVIEIMTNDICASVPYHLGQSMPYCTESASAVPTSTEQFSLDDTNLPRVKPDPEMHERAAKSIGGYFLVWQLFVAVSSMGIPHQQRLWIKGRLLSIGQQYGIGQANVLAVLGMNNIADERGMSITDMAPPLYEPYSLLEEAILTEQKPGLENRDEAWQASHEGRGFERWKREFLVRLADEGSGGNFLGEEVPQWSRRLKELEALERLDDERLRNEV